MITVNVKQFVSAIEDADAFRLPDMSVGADYIYNTIYKRLSCGEEVRLSQIDYDAFELEDIDTMREIYFTVLEADEYKSDGISRTLWNIPPAVTAAAFV